jgi:transcription initiation factor TFIIH subunit 4
MLIIILYFSHNRFLPDLAQHVVNRLMTFAGPIPFLEVRSWFQPAHKAVQNKILWRLKQLNILQGRGQEVWMNEQFQMTAFTGFSSKGSVRPSSTASTDGDFIKTIDAFSRTQWESVLYELVKGENDHSNAAGDKRSKLNSKSNQERLNLLLKDSGLVSNGRVTNSGFQFLLRDVSSQIWILLIHYLKGLNSPASLHSNLLFIARVVLHSRPGDRVPSDNSEMAMFEQFGLVMRQQKDWIVTRLFSSLTGVKNELDFAQQGSSSSPSTGFLVVETNYRIYAYTASPLQIATLGLFIRLQDRFPNLVYGQLDMETVQRAMAHGITADQIIHYLQINVHSCMLSRTESSAEPSTEASSLLFNGIPFTVIDQIKLWEQNRNRLIHRLGFLYQQFMSEREFSLALSEAKTKNFLLYAKPQNRLMLVSPDGHEHMKQFIKSIK